MNNLMILGLLLVTAYIAGLLCEKAGLPKIIGFIITGLAFSPGSIGFADHDFIRSVQPVMEVCLAFIIFEIGGELKWTKIKQHKKEVISISTVGNVLQFVLTASGLIVIGKISGLFAFNNYQLVIFATVSGALAALSAPATVLSIMRQYKARGKVTETILELVALKDVFGVLFFSLTIEVISLYGGNLGGKSFINALGDTGYQIILAIVIGAAFALVIDLIAEYLNIAGEGQWVVIIFSLLIFCVGIVKYLEVDEFLAYMTMGMVVVNTCKRQEEIFRILRRYTENFIFLIFFLLSGLHIDISVIPQATPLIIIFVLLRFLGKYLGVYTGARLVHADRSIRKYVAGGLVPQAGVAIGLVLSIYGTEGFEEISDMLLATIMGATIINELTGPLLTRYSLRQSGDIKESESTR